MYPRNKPIADLRRRIGRLRADMRLVMQRLDDREAFIYVLCLDFALLMDNLSEMLRHRPSTAEMVTDFAGWLHEGEEWVRTGLGNLRRLGLIGDGIEIVNYEGMCYGGLTMAMGDDGKVRFRG